MSQTVGRSLLTSLLVEDSDDEDLNNHFAVHPALIDQNSNGASNFSDIPNYGRNENSILVTTIVESANNSGEIVIIGDQDHSMPLQLDEQNQQNAVAAAATANNDVIEVNENDNNIQSDVAIEEEDDDDEEFEFKSKLPRFNSNLDIKESAKESKTEKEDSGGDEEVCSICFEPWTNSGIHRLVCLKCGHLFGEGCIDRWVKSNPKCPQCNRPSKRTDIRRIYAKSIKVIDTAELDKALKDLEIEKQERKKAEINASEMKLQYNLVFEELNITKKRYKELLERSLQMANQENSGMCSSSLSNITNRMDSKGSANMSFNLEKMMNLTETGSGCRCIGFSSRNLAILASQPSNNPIFPGFGIKKINILDFKLSQYIPIHSKMIRDIALSSQPNDETLLTGGLDKMLKLTNLSTNRLIHSYECTQPIWSCAYNTDNPIYFYAGLANGHVLLFDKRKIDGYVKILNDESTMGSPVCSLQYVSRDNQNPGRRHCGLMTSQLDKISFYQIEQEEHRYSPLLMESNIMSMAYHNSGHVLVSTRPTQKYPTVRHLVYEFSIQNNSETSSLSLIQTFNGANVQKMLARSKLFFMDSKLYGLSPCEQSKTALIWDVAAGETMAKLPNTSEIIDVCPIKYNENNFMCTLTDKQLRIFRRINNN